MRERWGSRLAFIMASLGCAVGLGNIWRFPYMCYTNGGGAFLIPYFIALLTAGIPLMILEFAVGRKTQGSPPLAYYKVNPKTEWLGWFANFGVMLIFFYYPVIMAWCLDYLFYSIKLQWGADPENFFNWSFLRKTHPLILGGLRPQVFIALIISWGLIYLSLFKGIKRLGQIVTYLMVVMWILITIMVIRGLTLRGSIEGLKFYLTPRFSVLKDPKVWLAAYGQIFFTLSLAMGSMIVYSSYLPERSDITNNAFIVSLGNCGFSFFAGFAVFSTLGYLATLRGCEVKDVVSGGFGLAFVTYPSAISKLPFGAPVFGVLFFLLLFIAGLTSAVSQVEPFTAGFSDRFGYNKNKVLALACGSAFLIASAVFSRQGGFYWLDIIDYFVCFFVITLVGLIECIVIGYVSKPSEWRKYINEVSEIKIGVWWDICIKIITPVILGVLFILQVINTIKNGYGGYPSSCLWVGFGVVCAILIASFLLMRVRRA